MRSFVIMLLSIITISCASSGYQQFYKPSQNASALSDVEYLTEGVSPKVYSSNDIRRDVKIMISKGFVIIGSSSFNGSMESEKQVVNQASRVGAVMVLVNSKYTGTQTTTIPLFLPNNTTTNSSGSIYGSGGYGTYSGSSTTYGSKVVPMTSQQQRYDQAAVYFVKSTKKPKFGILIVDLAPELRATLERNTGALIEIVREDSPAFLANVLPGDVIIEFDGISVRNAKHALQLMKDATPLDGKCQFKIIRKGIEKIIFIQLENS